MPRWTASTWHDKIHGSLNKQQTFEYGGSEWTAKAYVGNVTGTGYEEISGYEMPKYVWGFQLGVKF